MIRNYQLKTEKIKKGLYLVSTPIGNLGDITFRSIEVLKKSDYILCEDTRVSKILLTKYEINSKLIANHKFNEKKYFQNLRYVKKWIDYFNDFRRWYTKYIRSWNNFDK